MKCNGCGKTFLADVPYLPGTGQITLGMQQHLAREIVNYPSIRELARAKRLNSKTVMFALQSAIALPRQGSWEKIAIRPIVIRRRTHWIAIDPRTMNTAILTDGNEQLSPENLAIRVAKLSPSEINLPINPELAAIFKAEMPETRLTISIPEMCDLSENILRGAIKRFSYKLRHEGLISEQAHKLCSTRSNSLTQAEELLLNKLSGTTPFWGSYSFKEYFHSLLEAGNVSYRQAIQESLEHTIEEVRPLFLPVYRQLIQLDQLGVEVRRDQEYEQLQLKLNLLRERLRKQGTRFEFPLLRVIIGLFFIGFGGPGLFGAFKQTLVGIRDIFWVPSSFWLSDVERRAILLA